MYLTTLSKLGIEPNFWCSREYADKAGLREVRAKDTGSVYVYDPATEWCVLPPIHPTDGYSSHTGFSPRRIWSDFVGFPGEELGYTPAFLDYEYIYLPTQFADLSGGQWITFRKNSRKWPRKHGDAWWYCDLPTENHAWTQSQVEDVLCDWLGTLPDGMAVHDDEVMLKYAREGEHREGLFDETGRLVGVNIWDDNHRFINYRYCICRPEKYLSEFMRLMFYRGKMGSGKKVNDGGVLDRDALKRFKDKLNPIRVRKVHSWTLST